MQASTPDYYLQSVTQGGKKKAENMNREVKNKKEQVILLERKHTRLVAVTQGKKKNEKIK